MFMKTKEKLWLKHYPEEISKQIAYDQIPLHGFLQTSAKQYGNMKALHFMGKETTYQKLYDEAKQIAHYLQDTGMEKGDRVAIMLPNCPQAVISYYGVLLAGGIVVQTNPLYTERELEYQLMDSGAMYIICLDILLPRVQKIRAKTSLKHTLVTKIKEYLPFPKNLVYPFIQKRQYNLSVKVVEDHETHAWSTIMQKYDPTFTEIPIDPKEDVALLQYTGGTTGKPKGVMLSHYNLVSNVQMCRHWMYKSEVAKEKVLGVLPFFHVYGMTTVMNLSVMMANTIILLPKFEAKDVLKTIDKEKPTLFPGAPTIYVGLIHHPDLGKYDLSSVDACISGSSSLPYEIQEQFEEKTGGKLVEGYGLTETSPVTHANFLWEKRIHGSIGVPWPDTDSKIVDMETREELPIGEVGEVVVKGPQVMIGYWNNREATDEVLQDGWMYTGDVGYMDEEGFFYIVDRKSDMIIAGGFNIYPREVEEVLYEYEGIQEVTVAGVPDDYRGETVKAFIVPKEGITLSEEKLNVYCRERLAAFKVPHQYEFRKELPKSAIGKILRRELVDENNANI